MARQRKKSHTKPQAWLVTGGLLAAFALGRCGREAPRPSGGAMAAIQPEDAREEPVSAPSDPQQEADKEQDAKKDTGNPGTAAGEPSGRAVPSAKPPAQRSGPPAKLADPEGGLIANPATWRPSHLKITSEVAVSLVGKSNAVLKKKLAPGEQVRLLGIAREEVLVEVEGSTKRIPASCTDLADQLSRVTPRR